MSAWEKIKAWFRGEPFGSHAEAEIEHIAATAEIDKLTQRLSELNSSWSRMRHD